MNPEGLGVAFDREVSSVLIHHDGLGDGRDDVVRPERGSNFILDVESHRDSKYISVLFGPTLVLLMGHERE